MKDTRGANLQRLLRVISRRRKWQFVGVAGFTLVGALAELVGIGAILPFLQLVAAPQSAARSSVVQYCLKLLSADQVADLILPAAILLITAAVVSAAVRILLLKVTFRYVFALTRDLSVLLFSRILRQPYGVFIQHNSSEALSGIEKVGYVGAYLISPLFQAFSSLIIAVAIVTLLLMIDPLTALLGGGSIALLYGMIALRTRNASLRRGSELSRLATLRTQLAQESLGGIRDIILDNSYEQFEERFTVVSRDISAVVGETSYMSQAPRYLIEGAGIVLIALLTLYFTSRPGGVMAAFPILGALALGAQRLLPLLQNINLAYVQSISMQGMLEDVLDLLERPVRLVRPRRAPSPSTRLSRSIELRDLSFAYANGPIALDGVNLVIPKGGRIGFVGRTGSGKSTALDLIMGLLEPSAGAVLVDGAPLMSTAMADWQAQIAHVPQAIFLIDSTIAANIAFGVSAAEIDLERVRDAARRADIAGYIEGLPDGYATTVGERGVRLSGGQRQRIGIARALYKNASVLILDEATSALDHQTETAVMAAIEALDRDLTVLLIAHRVSTLRGCDTVVRLDHGRIAQVGSYREVVSGLDGGETLS